MSAIAASMPERVQLIVSTLLPAEPVAGSVEDGVRHLEKRYTAPSAEVAYLVLAVLRSAIPSSEAVAAAVRDWRVAGLAALIEREARARSLRLRLRPPVRVTAGVVVDVTDTARTPYTTGIQRVARESVAHWPADQFELVCWDRSRPRIHEATAAERALVVGGDPKAGAKRTEVVVPFRARYVLPEIAVAKHRYSGIRSIARHSGSHVSAIGFDCIAITTGEIAPPGMPAAFAKYLSALASFDEVVAISSAAGAEFEGWRRMLGGAGLTGPRVSVAELPFSVGTVSDAVVDRVRQELGISPDVPLVVAIGSHEPRKNHVAFLHACELLWQQGLEFAVVMAGGAAWNSGVFDDFVAELKARGRALTTVSRASDETIWSLYRLARFSVFCSLNEGFGLPVAESLASGTPVITSNFGSMRDLAEGHGGMLADPREPRSIAAAIRVLLEDDAEYTRLVEETGRLPQTSWDDYAATLWGVFAPESGS